MYEQNNNVTYFDSFGVEHILKEIRAFIDRSLSITTNIFRMQAYDSIMCGYFCIGYIDFMLAGKTLTEFTNLFSRNKVKRNDDVILNYFITNVYKWVNAILLIVIFRKTKYISKSKSKYIK